MKLLTPTEKMMLLESKAIPESEVSRIAERLREKFRFTGDRTNANLIDVYLAKVEVEEDGEVKRDQEPIRRMAKVMDKANTELVAQEISSALKGTGVYEFKIPKNMMDTAKDLANAIVDNGFSFHEFMEWLNATKAYKTDAEDIMDASDVGDMEGLYTQLLGIANESAEHPKEANECKVGDTVMADGKKGKVTAITKEGQYEVQELDGSKFGGKINLFDKDDLEPVHEGKMTIKRPYRRGGVELTPAVSVKEDAAIRNEIVKFIGGKVLYRASMTEIKGHMNTMNENEAIGRVPSKNWLYHNTHLVKRIRVGKETYFKLTRAGLNLYNKIKTQVNEIVNENKVVKTIEDKENQRKYEFFKSPSGKIEYQLYDWDEVDGSWSKSGAPSDDIDWLFAEECPEINAFLEKNGIKVSEATEPKSDTLLCKTIEDAHGKSIAEIRKEIGELPEGETYTLLQNYSINVQSKYEDGEELDGDFDELEHSLLAVPVMVNQYDDLIADPHGIMNEAAGAAVKIDKKLQDDLVHAALDFHKPGDHWNTGDAQAKQEELLLKYPKDGDLIEKAFELMSELNVIETQAKEEETDENFEEMIRLGEELDKLIGTKEFMGLEESKNQDMTKLKTISESIQESFGKSEKGGMHKKLGIPEGDKISDHYKDGKALASHLLSANNDDKKKTASELSFAANQGKSPDPIFHKALSALKEMDKKD